MSWIVNTSFSSRSAGRNGLGYFCSGATHDNAGLGFKDNDRGIRGSVVQRHPDREGLDLWSFNAIPPEAIFVS